MLVNNIQAVIECSGGVFIKTGHVNSAGEYCAIFTNDPFYGNQETSVEMFWVSLYVNGKLKADSMLDYVHKINTVSLFKFDKFYNRVG